MSVSSIQWPKILNELTIKGFETTNLTKEAICFQNKEVFLALTNKHRCCVSCLLDSSLEISHSHFLSLNGHWSVGLKLTTSFSISPESSFYLFPSPKETFTCCISFFFSPQCIHCVHHGLYSNSNEFNSYLLRVSFAPSRLPYWKCAADDS